MSNLTTVQKLSRAALLGTLLILASLLPATWLVVTDTGPSEIRSALISFAIAAALAVVVLQRQCLKASGRVELSAAAHVGGVEATPPRAAGQRAYWAEAGAGHQPAATASLASVDGTAPGSDGDWRGLVEDSLELVDEMQALAGRPAAPQRELCTHVVWRLSEVMQRSGVEVISELGPYDRARHASITRVTADDGAQVTEVLWPGFTIGREVLRRATVRTGPGSGG